MTPCCASCEAAMTLFAFLQHSSVCAQCHQQHVLLESAYGQPSPVSQTLVEFVVPEKHYSMRTETGVLCTMHVMHTFSTSITTLHGAVKACLNWQCIQERSAYEAACIYSLSRQMNYSITYFVTGLLYNGIRTTSHDRSQYLLRSISS